LVNLLILYNSSKGNSSDISVISSFMIRNIVLLTTGILRFLIFFVWLLTNSLHWFFDITNWVVILNNHSRFKVPFHLFQFFRILFLLLWLLRHILSHVVLFVKLKLHVILNLLICFRLLKNITKNTFRKNGLILISNNFWIIGFTKYDVPSTDEFKISVRKNIYKLIIEIKNVIHRVVADQRFIVHSFDHNLCNHWETHFLS